jgi:DNA-binding MarR family transcriptional regulator
VGNLATNALQVLVVTPHIHKYLTEHDPKALLQAIMALRYTLSEEELQQFDERLARAAIQEI